VHKRNVVIFQLDALLKALGDGNDCKSKSYTLKHLNSTRWAVDYVSQLRSEFDDVRFVTQAHSSEHSYKMGRRKHIQGRAHRDQETVF